MCILELSEVFMYKFDYDYIKNKYDNKSILLFTDTVKCTKLKLKMSTKVLATIKKCLLLVIIRASQNTIIQTNK